MSHRVEGVEVAAPGDVLCLSHLRWGFVYQRPNHLMSRCARRRRVFFVEEPVWGSDAPRLDVRVVEGRLHLAVPHLPDGLSGREAEAAQARLLADLAVRERVRSPLLWIYTPMAMGLARHVDTSLVVYDCMDELSLFHGCPPELAVRERELFRRADLVFTGGHSLWEAKRDLHPRVHAFPSSVDAEHFAVARRRAADPDDQRSIPRPRIGFFGVVDERFDRDLVRAVAALRPHWQLVVVGPIAKIDPRVLPTARNIHWLGQKSYAELPRYLAGWDVAMMPFARNDATRFISPTKTLEYLAAGKPVVSTSIRDVVRPYGREGLARIADKPADFVRAIEAALSERGTPAGHARRAAADAWVAQTSWDRTWERMDELVRSAVSARKSRAEPRAGATAAPEEAAPCSTT